MGYNYHDHHNHHHNPAGDLKGKKLLWVSLLNLSITIVQIIGGLISNSLSLLSDALHNLGDSSAIFIAFLAGRISQKKPNENRTFGYNRIEILAAFFNGILLISICIFLFYEAYKRFLNPEPIKGKVMFIIAIFGFLVNFLSVLVLNKHKKYSLNIKAAYLHLLGDTLSSVAVIIGGIAIWKFGMFWIDPLITVFVGVYIVYHTWGVVKETVDILMQSTPYGINIREMKKDIEKLDEIKIFHHVHVWKLDDTQIHLEAHVNVKNNIDMVKMMSVKDKVENILETKFNINHITLQFGYYCCNDNGELIYTKE